jgi:hypothetical protein
MIHENKHFREVMFFGQQDLPLQQGNAADVDQRFW